jgi:branched-subunit amino acid aminotransferase/4-amino-4-deoxychorismate lyase
MASLLFYHDGISGVWARTDGNSFLLNRGFAYGDGIFDTIALFNHTIIWQDFHLAKLQEAAAALSLPFERDAVASILAQCAAMQKDGKIRIYVHRSGSLGDIDLDAGAAMLCFLEDFSFTPFSNSGQALIVKEPIQENSVMHRHKTLNRLSYLLADRERLGTDYTHALMLNSAGRVACFTNSVVLWAQNGQCYYVPPTEGCIYGVGLRACLEFAQKEGLQLDPKPLEVRQLSDIEGLVAANSFWARPMARVNDIPILISDKLQKIIEGAYSPFRPLPGA